MGATCTLKRYRNSCNFFSEKDKKKKKINKKAMVILKIQVIEPGPSWPSCLAHLNVNVLDRSFWDHAVSVVNNFFKHQLLLNRWANWNQTWQECSLGGPL